jgi:hypothetical protein
MVIPEDVADGLPVDLSLEKESIMSLALKPYDDKKQSVVDFQPKTEAAVSLDPQGYFLLPLRLGGRSLQFDPDSPTLRIRHANKIDISYKLTAKIENQPWRLCKDYIFTNDLYVKVSCAFDKDGLKSDCTETERGPLTKKIRIDNIKDVVYQGSLVILVSEYALHSAVFDTASRTLQEFSATTGFRDGFECKSHQFYISCKFGQDGAIVIKTFMVRANELVEL